MLLPVTRDERFSAGRSSVTRYRIPSSLTRFEPIVRFGALLRMSASFTSCDCEYDERLPARSS